MTTARMYGDWKSVMPKIKIIQESITPETVEALREVGEEYNNAIIKNIREQRLPLLPPAMSTQHKKKAHKTEWWIEEEKFIKKLAVHQWYKGKHTASVVAGALKRRKYDKKRSMFELANRIENGWSQAPARPLFRLTLEELDLSSVSKKVGFEIRKIWDMG